MKIVAGTTPYSWPFAGDFTPERVAVVVVGLDTDWIAAASGTPFDRDRLTQFIDHVRGFGVFVIGVSHNRGPTRGGSGPTIPSDLGAWGDAHVIAGGIDAFFGSDLDEVVRRAERPLIALAGFGLEGPVHSTLRSANDRGYECVVLADLCPAIDEACASAAVSTIEMSGGIFGAVGHSDAFRDALTTTPLEVR